MGRCGADRKGYGLLRFAHGAWTSYESPEIDGKNMKVQSLLSDREGSLWIGTSDKGLYRIANGRLDHFDTTTGLSANTGFADFCGQGGGSVGGYAGRSGPLLGLSGAELRV